MVEGFKDLILLDHKHSHRQHPIMGVKFLTRSNKVVLGFFSLLDEPELSMDHLLTILNSRGLYLPKTPMVRLARF